MAWLYRIHTQWDSICDAAARSALSMGNESVVDTGYTWITKSNLNDNEVKKMLYNE